MAQVWCIFASLRIMELDFQWPLIGLCTKFCNNREVFQLLEGFISRNFYLHILKSRITIHWEEKLGNLEVYWGSYSHFSWWKLPSQAVFSAFIKLKMDRSDVQSVPFCMHGIQRSVCNTFDWDCFLTFGSYFLHFLRRSYCVF